MDGRLETKLIEISTGIQIEYSLTGPEDKDTIIFVHDLGMSLHQFALQESFFTQDYRVLLVSLRGHGKTTLPPQSTRADFLIKELARDIQVLLLHLEIGQVHVVGAGLGGLVGFELLEFDTNAVLSLTFFSTPVKMKPNPFKFWILLLKHSLFGTQKPDSTNANIISSDESVVKQVVQMAEGVSDLVYKSIARQLISYNYTNVITHHTVPILMIRGEADTLVNIHLQSILSDLQARSNFRLVDVSNGGRFVNMERAAMFNPALLGFLHSL